MALNSSLYYTLFQFDGLKHRLLEDLSNLEEESSNLQKELDKLDDTDSIQADAKNRLECILNESQTVEKDLMNADCDLHCLSEQLNKFEVP